MSDPPKIEKKKTLRDKLFGKSNKVENEATILKQNSKNSYKSNS
jgi:hypothetical protein